MGAWSHKALDNDTACDWSSGLEDCDDLSLVESAIGAVLANADAHLDASIAEEALAAIEVIARMHGHPGYQNAYTETVDTWVVRTQLKPNTKLVNEALAALDAIAGDQSELRELWSEGDSSEWIESIDDLRARVQAQPQAVAALTALTQAVDAGDVVAQIIKRLSSIQFRQVELPDQPPTAMLYNAILTSSALGDVTKTRELIAQIWASIAESENESILWDLAIREAQTWASQGYVDEALTQLEAWRCSAAVSTPGLFEYRATSVCLVGRDLERARSFYLQAIRAAPNDLARQFDLALLEARLGSVSQAQALLKQAGSGVQNLPRMFVALVEGIIAYRLAEPKALELLTEATDAFVTLSQQNPAGWSVVSFCAGWWALALNKAGKRDQAHAALKLTEAILMQPYNRELITELQEQDLLASNGTLPLFAVADQNQLISPSSAHTDHGCFKSIRIRGVNALKKVEALRLEFERGSRLYPFLIGDQEQLLQLLEFISPPQDGGREALTAAKNFDVAAWLQEKMPKPIKGWPKQTVPSMKTPLIQFDVLSQKLKPELVIGLIELDHPSELFARIGYGDMNDCPTPHIHTALHAYWQQHYGAQPISVSDDIVECVVANPPTEKTAALNLAREQHAYCYDIVEQGVGTTAKLGSSLLEARYWYFWWD